MWDFNKLPALQTGEAGLFLQHYLKLQVKEHAQSFLQILLQVIIQVRYKVVILRIKRKNLICYPLCHVLNWKHTLDSCLWDSLLQALTPIRTDTLRIYSLGQNALPLATWFFLYNPNLNWHSYPINLIVLILHFEVWTSFSMTFAFQ